LVREAESSATCQSLVLGAGKISDFRAFWHSAVLGDREPNARNLETQRAQRTTAESAETNIPRIGRLIVVTGISLVEWRAVAGAPDVLSLVALPTLHIRHASCGIG
jgi:hypothetical protein